MAADLSHTNPSSSAPITSASNSPKSHLKTFPSPWAQVVRGGEPVTLSAKAPSPSSSSSSPEKPIPSDCRSAAPQGDSATAEEVPPESSDCTNGNASVSKKSAWGRPENGVVGAGPGPGPGPVMGASWPTISESTRPLPKSSSDSSDSLKPVSNGSISISEGPVISHAPQKQASTNRNPNFTPKNTQPVRQRSMKRGGGIGGGSGHSGFSRPPAPGPPPPPPLPPPFPIPFGNLLPPVMELPIREPPYNGNIWETRPIGGAGSHSQAGNDHSSHRHSSRRGNSGSRPRGDGVYHNGYRGRRDQDRDWNAPRNSTARDIHMHQMAPPPPRAFMRPAITGSTSFIPPQHVRPFGNPMAFDMVPPYLYAPPLPPESLRGVPFIAHPLPPAMFFPVMDPNVLTLLVSQIDYYFSDANLVKDDFLRSNMDDQGWVNISLIASFPRVLNLTSNIQLILDTLGASTVVEVQGDKVRRREDWRKWIPPSGQVPPVPSLLSPSESTDKMMATSIQKVSLDEVTTNQLSTMDMEDAHSEIIPGRSEAMITRSKLANGEDTAEAAYSS